MICGATGLHNRIASATFLSFSALSVESVGVSNDVQRLPLFCLLAEALCAVVPSELYSCCMSVSCLSLFQPGFYCTIHR